jgi:hypothetical protein
MVVRGGITRWLGLPLEVNLNMNLRELGGKKKK